MSKPWWKRTPEPAEPMGGPPRASVPLGRALLCAEEGCEAIYAMDGALGCPVCGSHSAWAISRSLNRRAS